MGGTALFSLGVRAMAANYAALQTTGHNIANANVEGYSRQRVELATAQGQYTGAGFFGRGVDVETVSRSYDRFLTREAATGKALAAADTQRLNQLRQLELIFKTGEQGLGNATSQFLNSMSDLASRPGDSATRGVVLSRADALAQRFVEAGSGLETVQRGVNESLSAAVDAVNALAKSLAEVNNRIAGTQGLGQPANDLLDQRDLLVSKLSEHLQVTTIPAADGTMGVFIGGGQRLVLGGQAEQLQLLRDRFDSSRSNIGIGDSNPVLRLSVSSLGAGGIAGLLRFQDNDLVAARARVGQMASAITAAVNAQQQLGINLQLPPGSVPSQAMFRVSNPLGLPANTNLKDANGAFVGSADLTVTDASQLEASEYNLQIDPLGSGRWLLTRLSDNVKRLIDSGDTVDGMRIDLNNVDAADQFLLQPVSRAAQNMQSLLTDARDIAAASPLVASTGTANAGTAQIGQLTMITAPLDPQATATVTFTSATDYSWELYDSGNNLISAGSGVWTPGQPIPSAPDPDINGFQLTMTGVPAAGDVLTIAPTIYPEANNGNAIALAGLRDRMLVGRDVLANGSFSGGSTFNEAYIAALSDVGVRTQSAQSSAAISGALASQAEAARSGQVGVNLDEEAARLIQFQQAYQASAKVLQVAQSVFDTLLDAAGA